MPRVLKVALLAEVASGGVVLLLGLLLTLLAFGNSDLGWAAVFLLIFAFTLVTYSAPVVLLAVFTALRSRMARALNVVVAALAFLLAVLYVPFATSSWSRGSRPIVMSVLVAVVLATAVLLLVGLLGRSSRAWFAWTPEDD